MGGFHKIDEEKRKIIIKLSTSDDPGTHVANRLACTLFFILALLLFGTRRIIYPGAIQCFCPAQFKDEQVKYIEAFCWVRNTYVVNFTENFPGEEGKTFREEREIIYYQWTQIIFIFQAFCFYVPRMFWLSFSRHTSINLKKLLSNSDKFSLSFGAEREEALQTVVQYLQKYFKLQNMKSSRYQKFENTKHIFAIHGIHRGNYLVFVFLVTSLLYLISTYAQFFLVDIFLGNNFKTMGFDYISRLVRSGSFTDQKRFPTVTFCDFEIRQLTNVQNWTVQCSLPINRFAEVLFLLDWMLLFVMTIVNAIYFLYSFLDTVLPLRGDACVRRFLNASEITYQYKTNDQDDVTKRQSEFIHSYLKKDGIFLFWLIGNKVNAVVASEIVTELWQKFQHQV